MKKTKHHSCRAIIVSCMDFRLGRFIQEFCDKEFKDKGFDRLALAGATKNLPFVLDQIELSVKLHRTKEAYLINHEDCGAYGETGNFKKHKEDLLFAKKIIRQKFPKLNIKLFYLKLNGEFVKV